MEGGDANEIQFNPDEKGYRRKRKKKEQEKLKEEAGINDQDIVIKTRSVRDYVVTLLRCTLYAMFIALIFIGLITTLNTDSRQVIVEIFYTFVS